MVVSFSTKLILIYIPARSAGGGLHGKTISPSRVRGGKAAVAGRPPYHGRARTPCAPQHDKQPERKQKMIVKFITMKGVSGIAAAPYYVGFVQHDRTMSRRETYEYCAERTGFKAAAIRAVFMALAEFIRENQRKGNITYLDGIASIRNYVKGSFAGLAGPWVKGVNYLSVQAVEMEPFKTLLAAILPVNNSEGAKPAINTVLDETTLVYDVITGTDVFSIAGSDLAPDATKDDEYVALVDAHGVETKAVIDFSDLQNVKAHLESGLLAGEYTLKVYTRSGLGEEFGVHVASRKVVVG